MNETPLKSSSDKLEALMYQFITLYERWSEDRQALVKQQAQFDKLMEMLIQQIGSLKQLDTQLQENVSQRIEETLNHTSQVVSNAIERSTTKHVKAIVNTLEQAVKRADGSLRTYRELFYRSLQTWVLAAVLGSVITAGLFAFMFVPRFSPSLTNEQLSDLSYGQFMETVWSKLPEKKRKELRTLYRNTLSGKKQTPIQTN